MSGENVAGVLAKTEDGVEIVHGTGVALWTIGICGLGSWEPRAVQRPRYEGPFVFVAGVGPRGSEYIPIINGVARGLWADREKLERSMSDAAYLSIKAQSAAKLGAGGGAVPC